MKPIANQCHPLPPNAHRAFNVIIAAVGANLVFTHTDDTAGKRAPGRFGGLSPAKKRLLMLLFASFAGKKKHQKRAIWVPQAPADVADELASRMTDRIAVHGISMLGEHQVRPYVLDVCAKRYVTPD